MSRLHERMEAGELALGAYIKGGSHIVATLAKAGFDFVRPDMMFSGIDWREMEHIIWVSKATNITPWVRIAMNPWLGGEDNLQCTVDAARAFSIGAEVVQASVASAKQVKALLEVTKDWHRSGAGQYPATKKELKTHVKKIAGEVMLAPSVETLTGVRDMDKILSLEGMKIIFIACTDLADQLGHTFDYEHPEVWAAFDKIVAKAKARGITVCANTGYVYRSKNDNIRRIAQLYEHGARIVMIQGIEFLIENYSSELLKDVRGEVASLK
jgi:2-keto-3-deoxy-L-rhamnonate aldolase RhmA